MVILQMRYELSSQVLCNTNSENRFSRTTPVYILLRRLLYIDRPALLVVELMMEA
jgi:hypothetical protein